MRREKRVEGKGYGQGEGAEWGERKGGVEVARGGGASGEKKRIREKEKE